MSRLRLLLVAMVVAACGVFASSALATNYYFSSSTGSDSNNCTSTSTPCQSLAKVNSLNLQPGDQVEFLRGDTWNGTLSISHSGTSAARINYFGYGTSSLRPKLQDLSAGGPCINASANFLTIDNLDLNQCGEVGLQVNGTDTLVKNMYIDQNATGLAVISPADTNVEIENNTITNNTSFNSPDPFGYLGGENIVLNGPAVVHNNTISANDVFNGSAGGYFGVGILLNSGGSNAWIYKNTIQNNHIGVWLAGSDGTTGVALEYNTIGASSAGDTALTGIKTADALHAWISHNSVDAVGSGSVALTDDNAADGTTITSNALKGGQYGLSAFIVDNPSGPSIRGNVINGGVNLTGGAYTLDSSNSTAAIGWVSPPLNLAEQSTSPTLDHATVTNFTTDIAGNPAPDTSGTNSDSGAYEYQGS